MTSRGPFQPNTFYDSMIILPSLTQASFNFKEWENKEFCFPYSQGTALKKKTKTKTKKKTPKTLIEGTGYTLGT